MRAYVPFERGETDGRQIVYINNDDKVKHILILHKATTMTFIKQQQKQVVGGGGYLFAPCHNGQAGMTLAVYYSTAGMQTIFALEISFQIHTVFTRLTRPD